MLNAMIRWSLANRLAVVIVYALLLAVGGLAATTMSVDVFPDLTAPTVTILVEGRSMAPEEMETLVTFPIEASVNGAAEVRRVRSATAVGISVIWVEFEWGADIYRARQTVAERLATVTGLLPSQVDPPVLAPTSSIMGEILFLSLTSDAHSLLELRTTAMTEVRRRLMSISGVSQVVAIGGDEKQFQAVMAPSRLHAFNVTLDEVITALSAANDNVSAGFLVKSSQELIVQGIGRFRTEADIRDTVVSVRKGRPVTVGDLGIVRVGSAIRRGAGASSRRGPNGEAITERGVVLAVQKQPNTNTLELTRRLDRALDAIQRGLPRGMDINRDLFRQAHFIESALTNTWEALRDGAVIVVVVVLLFLAGLRPGLITIAAIPVSLVVTLLTLRFLNAGVNTMTLGGMAIAIGMLVDDAIIDVENVVRRLKQNAVRGPEARQPTRDVIYQASVEVRTSIVFATIIIMLVFCPLFVLSGVEGRLLQPLGVAFLVSLAASLLVALTLTPAVCSYVLPNSPGLQLPVETRLVAALKRAYVVPLDWALCRPKTIALPVAAIFAVSAAFILRSGRDFLPPFNEGALVIGLVSSPGISLQESDRLADIAQRTIMRHPEVVAIGRRTGRAEQDEHVQGVEASEIDLTLDMHAGRLDGRPVRSRQELVEALRTDLAMIPGVRTTIGQPISHRIDHMLSGSRASIAVKIFGEDLRRLRTLAAQVNATISDVHGVVDLSVEQQSEVATVRLDFDRDRMARHGLTIEQLTRTLQSAFRGTPVGSLFEERVAYDCVVQLGGPDAWPNESMGDIPVDTPRGYKVPLHAVADIAEDTAPNFISRENLQRKMVVTCNVAGRDVGSVVEEIQQRIADRVELPSGYFIEYGGQFESAQEVGRRLGWLTLLVVVGIGFLLHAAFHSARDALLIMLNLPLALIGGAVGVYFSGSALSVASLIGFISVFGIAARNGIMLVSHIRHIEQHEGARNLREAVRRGAMERLAPILMTALSSGLALIPLALGGDEPGKEILMPMAMVIFGGLISATLLNLLLVPALFVRLARPISVR